MNSTNTQQENDTDEGIAFPKDDSHLLTNIGSNVAIITPEKLSSSENSDATSLLDIAKNKAMRTTTTWESSFLPNVITLNVGGCKFTTSKSTLFRHSNTYFEAMFSRHTLHESEDGSYFIDRDGSHFRHILNYLRAGVVLTLPKDPIAKNELAVEADFYGLDGLVKDIKLPLIDISQFLPNKTLKQWKTEANLRTAFLNGSAKGFIDPFRGLVALFPQGKNDDEDELSLPLQYNPNHENLIAAKKQDAQFMETLRSHSNDDSNDSNPNVTVKTLGAFRSNFNRHWSNVLHRLQNVLLEEPVIIAGGAVLRALTDSRNIRTQKWWTHGSGVRNPSDIDLFLYTNDKEEANRISRRIFYSVAIDNEKWLVIRSRGVINIHRSLNGRVDAKIQIVLRLYDSPTEVLIGFDVDCCCCAYDGRNVWVCPRWISSLTSGLVVLNPLHAWPKRASYEFRLAKYAFRGFATFVPGIDQSRIDFNRIRRSPLSEHKGLARFLKIASEMEGAPSHSCSEWDQAYVRANHILRPPTPREIAVLREDEIGVHSEDERLIDLLDFDYDEDGGNREVLIPTAYNDLSDEGNEQWLWIYQDFPMAEGTRDSAWEEIENNAGKEVPGSLERRLIDAWDTSKRCREFFNGEMEKYDLDNLYYSQAYKNGESGET